jgi:hypothetical protein
VPQWLKLLQTMKAQQFAFANRAKSVRPGGNCARL